MRLLVLSERVNVTVNIAAVSKVKAIDKGSITLYRVATLIPVVYC